MNENIDLREILKDVPMGTKLYSPILGEVEFQGILDREETYPITVSAVNDNKAIVHQFFTYDGRYINIFNNGECLLFPSRDQHDWSKFEAPKPERKKIQVHLNPFDRVLTRDNEENNWHIDLYERYEYDAEYPHTCLYSSYNQVIPYNEDTRPLIDTNNAPTIDYEIIPWNKDE